MNSEQGTLSLKTIVLGVVAFVAITILLTVAIQVIGAEQIRSAIEQAGPLAPLLYILIRVVTFVIAPLSSGPILFSAGVLFGLKYGILYSLISEVVAGSINFWIARKFGRSLVSRLVGEEGMKRIDSFYHQFGEVWALVYARLFLFSVYDFISYTAGFTPMKYRHYALVTTVVGIVPVSISVYIGTTLTQGLNSLIGLYIVLAVLSVLPLLFYGRIRRLLKVNAETPDNPVSGS